MKLNVDGQLEFDDNGNLPPGIYEITIEEIKKYYSFSPKRKKLINGLKEMLEALKDIGCKKFYLDGSFVTDKLEPSDFDACWELHSKIDLDKLKKKYPELLLFNPPRTEQKSKYLGEALISNQPLIDESGNKVLTLDFFQKDRAMHPKGILLIKL